MIPPRWFPVHLPSFNWAIAASPTYIEKALHGSPENLDDLQNHAVGCLNHRTGRTPPELVLRVKGKDYAMRVRETLVDTR